jgi:hypothetical protein
MKRHQPLVCLLVGTMIALVAGGCTQRVEQEQSFARERFANVPPERAMQVAEQVFRQYFSVDYVDASEGALYSRPTELSGRGSPERVRDLLTRTPNRRREVAELRLVPRGNDVIALCRVQVQRLDTLERRAFAPQTGDDRPANNPPLGAEAGASARQREDWTEVGRNRTLEQRVLASLRERLVPGTTTRPSGTP